MHDFSSSKQIIILSQVVEAWELVAEEYEHKQSIINRVAFYPRNWDKLSLTQQ